MTIWVEIDTWEVILHNWVPFNVFKTTQTSHEWSGDKYKPDLVQ